jgi:NAD(P) transhydrogenase subunit alpha
MIVGVPRESFPGERRVALIPSFVDRVKKLGLEVVVQKDAGIGAGFTDNAYKEQGARILANRMELYGSADIVFHVRAAAANPQKGLADLKLMRRGLFSSGSLIPMHPLRCLGSSHGERSAPLPWSSYRELRGPRTWKHCPRWLR